MNKLPKICAVILTKNEEIHLQRCINSVRSICEKIYVIDSFSQDQTQLIAQQNNCEFVQHEFLNQAQQFNFALQEVVSRKFTWCLRIDADEYLENPASFQNLLIRLNNSEINGVAFRRNIVFLGRMLRYGNLGPQRVVRLFRIGFGRSENRTMDEHIIVDGRIIDSDCRIIDHCLNGYDYWVQKHLNYAKRQSLITEGSLHLADGMHFHAKLMRIGKFFFEISPWYVSIPMYFIFRYVFLLGFLDGRAGFLYLFNQVAWYRLVVLLKRKYEN